MRDDGIVAFRLWFLPLDHGMSWPRSPATPWADGMVRD